MVSSGISISSGGCLVGEHRQSERGAAAAHGLLGQLDRGDDLDAQGQARARLLAGADRVAKSSSSSAQRLFRLRRAGSRRRRCGRSTGARRSWRAWAADVHSAVVDPHRFVRGGVVVLDHPLAADDDHLADLARREPGDLHVGGLARREVSVRKAVSGTPWRNTLLPEAATSTTGCPASREGSRGRAERGRRPRRPRCTCRGSCARRSRSERRR